MPRLPDATSLGQRPDARSGRPIATFDTTAVGEAQALAGRGQQAFGQGMAALGQGVGRYADHLEREEAKEQAKVDKLQDGLARTDWVKRQTKADEAAALDLEPEGWAERHIPQLEAARKAAAEQITDPGHRELFLATTGPAFEQKVASLRANEAKLIRDRDIKTTDEALAEATKQFAAAPDPATRMEIKDGVTSILEGMRERGYIDQEGVRRGAQEWLKVGAVRWGEAQPPAEKVRLFGGFEAALKQQESGGRAGIVNDAGYVGHFQFGGPRVADLGVYTPGKGEQISGGGWSGQKWSGTFNIPGHPEVKTLDDFRASPAAQKAVFQLHTQRMDQEIQSQGLEKFIGTKVAGVEITRDGLYGMIHLGGAGGARRALESGGKDNPRDSNGTSVLAYAKKFGGSANSLAQFVPEEQKPKLAREGRQQLEEQQRQEESIRGVQRYELGRQIEDDLASVRATGRGIESLAPSHVTALLGEAKTQEWLDRRSFALQLHDVTAGFDQLPTQEIESRVESLAPREADAAEGFATRAKLYKETREAADKIIEARTKDPAAAVERSPVVLAAKERLRAGDSLEAREALVDARLASQAALGVPEYLRSPITQAEAKLYAAKMRPLARGQAEAMDQSTVIEGVVHEVNERYGRHAPEVLKRSLYEVTLKRDASEVLAAAIGRMQTTDSGPLVSAQETRRIEAEVEAERVERAIGQGGTNAAPPPRAETGGRYSAPQRRETPLEDPPAARQPQQPYTAALDLLRSDPERLMPFFVQRYGLDRVPADLRQLYDQTVPQPKGAR